MHSLPEDHDMRSENGDDVAKSLQVFSIQHIQGNLTYGFDVGSYWPSKPVAGAQGGLLISV
jgi:hypothetical protein